MAGEYAPASVTALSGEELALTFDPANVFLKPLPPVRMLSAGAVALPGGSYTGNQPVQVGDWSEVPMARLVSLKGKSLPPLQVRFWAEIQRVTLPAHLPLAVGFQLRKGGQPVAPTVFSSVPATIYPEGILDVPAFTADLNSLELTAGKLTLFVVAYTAVAIPLPVGQWEFPVEVVDLGQRWYAGHVKNPKLTVTRKDFFQLRYAFAGALPNLPGVGTPLFQDELDLEFVTVENRFDLGVELNEFYETYGAWGGKATAKADLTLFSVELIDQQRKFNRKGSSLANCTYELEPLSIPLLEDVCVPIFGPALPKKVNLCGLKFGGSLGVKALLRGKRPPDLGDPAGPATERHGGPRIRSVAAHWRRPRSGHLQGHHPAHTQAGHLGPRSNSIPGTRPPSIGTGSARGVQRQGHRGAGLLRPGRDQVH